MEGLAEDRGAADAEESAGDAQGSSYFGRSDFHSIGARGLHVGQFAQGIWRAVGDELAVINVGDVVAALGLIHVVRGDKKRDPVSGKSEGKVPAWAAGNGA